MINSPYKLDTPAEAALALNTATYVAGRQWTPSELNRAHMMYERYAREFGADALDNAIKQYTNIGRDDYYRLQYGENP